METKRRGYLCIFFPYRSYPTYEEWKHGDEYNRYVEAYFSSYPTYEEWKLIFTAR